MGFLTPKAPVIPTPPPPPTPAAKPLVAKDSSSPTDPFQAPSSLISTSPSGLRRKASTERTSLIGG